MKTKTSKFLNKTLALVKESKYEIETSGPGPPGPRRRAGPISGPARRKMATLQELRPFTILQIRTYICADRYFYAF